MIAAALALRYCSTIIPQHTALQYYRTYGLYGGPNLYHIITVLYMI